MAIKAYKPTTPGQRGKTTQDFSDITTRKPLKSLIVKVKKNSGRNNQGRITTRHQGGGAKTFYRKVSFRLPDVFIGTVEHIEYDPNRSARIARVKQDNGKYYYVLASSGMKIGHVIRSGNDIAVEDGSRFVLKDMPIGSTIHNIEIYPGRGGQLVRSAGNGAQLMGRDNGYAQVRLPSGEVRLINESCTASIGVIGNDQHQNVKLGKAGSSRHRGIRPSVRGVVMNAVDHPHGGGDGGRHGIGGGKDHGAAPKTPWGQKTLGYKTRRNKTSSKFILRNRHVAKRK